MNDNQYRNILREHQCSFCHTIGEQLVSWHHLLCIGQHGKSMKSPPWAAIPICTWCHRHAASNCHNYGIERGAQKMALVRTWRYVLVGLGKDASWLDKVDVTSISNDYWKRNGEKFWGML